jgi:hypothetical protein
MDPALLALMSAVVALLGVIIHKTVCHLEWEKDVPQHFSHDVI